MAVSAAPWVAALVALFSWWFSTGAILWAVKRADGQGRGAHGRVALGALPLLVLGVALAVLSFGRADTAGIYAGFLAALAIWGWVELAFLTGCITGTRRGPMPLGAVGPARFRAAWGALCWHELLLTAGFVALIWASLGAENATAAWTYGVLYLARISAKLNIFLGVPRINVDFLPRPLAHLPSYFRQGPVSRFFPLSILVLGLASAFWLERAVSTGGAEFALLATLTLLALLEHGLMVIPLPDAKLWRWALPGEAGDGADR